MCSAANRAALRYRKVTVGCAGGTNCNVALWNALLMALHSVWLKRTAIQFMSPSMERL